VPLRYLTVLKVSHLRRVVHNRGLICRKFQWRPASVSVRKPIDRGGKPVRIASALITHHEIPEFVNSTRELVEKPSGERKESDKVQGPEAFPLIIVTDTNSITLPLDNSIPEICRTSHSPTSVCSAEQFYLGGSGIVKRRRGTKSDNSIDLEQGKPTEYYAPKSTSGENESEGDGQSQTDSAPGTGNLDDTGSVESDERTSIQTHQASIPPFSQSQIPGLPVADAVVDSGLFHTLPETKYLRSVFVAQVGFVILTLLVLGNLIYTYVPLQFLV
jgi:hypothetical protein